MPTRLAPPAVLLLAMAACSGTNPPADVPVAIDPTGFYDFTATMGPDTRTGTLEIERTAAGLDGEAYLEGEGEPALADSVRVDGSHVVLYMLAGTQDVTFDLEFAGPAFAGNIVVEDMSIAVQGQRRAQ